MPCSNWSPRFPGEIGVITGLVGTAGGLGGFVLPNVLGSLKQLTQSYAGGFLAFALVERSGRGRPVLRRQNLGGHVFGQGRGRAGPANAGKHRSP